MNYERERQVSGGDAINILSGTLLGGSICVGIGIIYTLAGGGYYPSMVDCGSGRQGSIDLMLPKDGNFSMSAIDGNNNISFKNNADGSLTIYFNNGNKTINLPGKIVTVSQISLQSGEKLSFEDNGAQIEVLKAPVQNGGMNVQVTGTCKK